jgi:hypothetical protein
VVRWVCMTHAARAPTTLHGAAGRILLIMVPLGAMTLVQQLVLHILRAPSATARDDRSWVHDAPCRAAAPPVHSERSADVRRASECDRVVHVAVSFACGACVCRRRAIGGSEARETGCRRCRASPGNAQHLHFVACEGGELPEVPGRVSVEARAVSWAIGCVLGDRGGDGSSAAAEAVMMVVVGSGSFATNSWSIGILLSMGECQRALVLALGPSAA